MELAEGPDGAPRIDVLPEGGDLVWKAGSWRACRKERARSGGPVLLNKESADRQVKTQNDPAAAGVAMTVGKNLDGYSDCERMCTHLRAALTNFEL